MEAVHGPRLNVYMKQEVRWRLTLLLDRFRLVCLALSVPMLIFTTMGGYVPRFPAEICDRLFIVFLGLFGLGVKPKKHRWVAVAVIALGGWEAWLSCQDAFKAGYFSGCVSVISRFITGFAGR